MDRDTKLKEKSTEIQSLLELWAKQNRLLNAGEQITFTMRISSVSLVQQDAAKKPRERMKVVDRGRGLLEPADLSEIEINELLSHFKSELGLFNLLDTLLRVNNNNPTLYRSYQSEINKKLQKITVAGKKFALVSHLSSWQLWVLK